MSWGVLNRLGSRMLEQVTDRLDRSPTGIVDEWRLERDPRELTCGATVRGVLEVRTAILGCERTTLS